MIRALDVFLSLFAMIILLPFMIPVMIGLACTGEHHVFYLQPRIGKQGKPFRVIKFATMLKDSPNLPGGYITQARDPRILPMGIFLRKTKINELPQLMNILIGQMSFVGPRPIVQAHLDLYVEEVRERILSLKPGLTGIGSLVFRDEEGILDRAGKERKYFHDKVIAPYKGQLEMWYAEHKGLGTYFTLIMLTAWSLLRPRSVVYTKFLVDLPKPSPELDAVL